MEANGVRSKSSSGGLTTLPATHRDRIPAMKFLALLLLLAAPGVANEPKDLPDYACPKHRIASQHTGITRSTGEGVKLCQYGHDWGVDGKHTFWVSLPRYGTEEVLGPSSKQYY